MTPPDLSKAEADRVVTILNFARNINHINEIDFYRLVTNANMMKYFGYSIHDQRPPGKRTSKKSLQKKTTQVEKTRTEKAKSEKSTAGQGKTEKVGKKAEKKKTEKVEKQAEKSKAEKGKAKKGKINRREDSKVASSDARETETVRDDTPLEILPSPQGEPSLKAPSGSKPTTSEDPLPAFPSMPASSLDGKSFTCLQGMPQVAKLLTSLEEEATDDSDSTEEPPAQEKLMGDAIKTGGDGSKRPRLKTIAMKKRKSTDQMVGKQPTTSKRPRYEDKVRSMLQNPYESESYRAFPIPQIFLSPLAEKANPSRMDTEIHNVSDNSDLDRDEHEEADNQQPPILRTQIPKRISPEPRPIVNDPPLETAKENAPSSSTNPTSETVPPSQSPSRGDKKLPIHSLKEGLRGCPLEALQALAPEDYIHGGVGKTTPDRFADIVVHHQIGEFSSFSFLFVFAGFVF
jgi:hypothetical protein